MNRNEDSGTPGFGGRGRRLAGYIVCLAASTLVLAGCGSWRQTFGLGHAPPDEFAVVAQAPLSVPPDFALRPPRPGAPRPQEMATSQAAASEVFGHRPTHGGMEIGRTTSGESSFLARADSSAALPDIRATLDAETRGLIAADKSWVDHLIFWKTQEEPYAVVNAPEEAKRLKANTAEGKPVTVGDTPTIERKRQAPLEGLF
jgi:hypothetical protein